MLYRKLGRTGIKVSAISLGTMTYKAQVGEAGATKLIKSALDNGINFFDTADGYPQAEELLGKALKGQRDAAIIATKVGGNTGPGINDTGLARKRVMEHVEQSLKRMQTDYIDLYYCHFPDYDLPIETVLQTMDILVKQGKVLHIGCSNFTAWQLSKALWTSEVLNLERFECIEPPYNLLTRDIEMELLPLCASEEVSVCVYNPLAAELLTGRHEYGKEPAEGRFTLEDIGPRYVERYWSEVNFQAIDRLQKIAKEHGCTMPQFALAWILNNPTITSAITGVINVEQLEENIGATKITLSPEELRACDEVWAMFRPPRYHYARDMRIRLD